MLELVEESIQNEWVLSALKATHLILVSKDTWDFHLGKFRPIFLCNVIYKIISKVHSNHLKPLIPSLISPEQYGYVEGRKILYSIILAHEITHSLKLTWYPGMLIKVELFEAFDKLSLEFIR